MGPPLSSVRWLVHRRPPLRFSRRHRKLLGGPARGGPVASSPHRSEARQGPHEAIHDGLVNAQRLQIHRSFWRVVQAWPASLARGESQPPTQAGDRRGDRLQAMPFLYTPSSKDRREGKCLLNNLTFVSRAPFSRPEGGGEGSDSASSARWAPPAAHARPTRLSLSHVGFVCAGALVLHDLASSPRHHAYGSRRGHCNRTPPFAGDREKK